MKNYFHNYRRCLLIGAGSGRDIVASVLFSQRPVFKNMKIDVAGFLTPWALHRFGSNLERPINKLTNRVSNKFIVNKPGGSLGVYLEKHLISLKEKHHLNHNVYYLLSLHSGLLKLKHEFQKLVDREKYDLILAVDVGGDILATHGDLANVYTPLVDQTCLSMLSSCKTKAEKLLAIVSPGVDGELTMVQIQKNIRRLRKCDAFIGRESIDQYESEYRMFLKIHDELNKKTNTESGTVTLLSHIIKKKIRENIQLTFKKNVSVGGKKTVLRFTRVIDTRAVHSIFYIDPTIVYRGSNIHLDYTRVFDAHVSLRPHCCGTELDLTYIPLRSAQGGEKYIYSLTPNNHLTGIARRVMLEYGVSLIRSKKMISAMVLNQDVCNIFVPKGVVVRQLSPDFSVFSSLNS